MTTTNISCADGASRFDCPSLDCPDHSARCDIARDGEDTLERELVGGVLFGGVAPYSDDIEPDTCFTLTDEGVAALSASPPGRCDFCHADLGDGALYFSAHLGMEEQPSRVGAPLDTGSLVEESSELIMCERCQPAVKGAFDTLLRTLWDLRKAEPARAATAEESGA